MNMIKKNSKKGWNLMSKKKYSLEPCAECGEPAQQKNVNTPFSHGWIGCKKCHNIIPWTGHGKMSVVDQWNAQQRSKRAKKEEA